MDKAMKLQKAINKFHNSDKNTQDYLSLFGVFKSVSAQGSGLMWYGIEKAINKGLKQK